MIKLIKKILGITDLEEKLYSLEFKIRELEERLETAEIYFFGDEK